MERKERTIEKHIFVILQTRLVVKNTGLHDKRCLINLRLLIFMGNCKFAWKNSIRNKDISVYIPFASS